MRQMTIHYRSEVVFGKLMREVNSMLRGVELTDGRRFEAIAPSDKDWFKEAFYETFAKINIAIQRIATSITDGETVEYSVNAYDPIVEQSLALAIERHSLNLLMQKWFNENSIPLVVDTDASESALRSIRIIGPRVVRKNTF